MHRALRVIVAVGAAGLGILGPPEAPSRADTDGHHEQTRVLDGVPVPPGSEMTRHGARARVLVVPARPTAVVAFLRTALPNAGWVERTAPRPSDRPSGRDGPATGADTTSADRFRSVYTRTDARLTVVVLAVGDADSQWDSTAEALDDVSELRIRIRAS